MSHDDLGDRMKGYEARHRQLIEQPGFSVVRVDGRAFHTFTRGLDRPFDVAFAAAMDATALALCAEISNARAAFVQSDEISIVTDDTGESTPWFGGVVQKMASVSASLATATFASAFTHPRGRGPALFDARVFTVPSPIEVHNYLLWRQADAQRNAISSIADHRFGPSRIHRATTGARRAMLVEDGFDFDDPDLAGFLHGRLARRVHTVTDVEYTHKGTGAVERISGVRRKLWLVEPSPAFRGSRLGVDLVTGDVPLVDGPAQGSSGT